MTKRSDQLLYFLGISIIIMIDQSSKWYARKEFVLPQDCFESFSLLQCGLTYNDAFFVGTLAGNSLLIISIISVVLAVFLSAIFFSAQTLLPSRAFLIRMGLSIIYGGICSNLIDRIWMKKVTDFLSFSIGDYLSPIYNLADLLQWPGYLMILYVVLFDFSSLWLKNDRRGRVWINLDYQISMIASILWINALSVLSSNLLAYIVLRETNVLKVFGENFTLIFIIMNILLFMSITFFSIWFLGRLTHRNCGPVYGFRMAISSLLKGNSRDFKVRKSDYYAELEITYKELKAYIESKEKSGRK